MASPDLAARMLHVRGTVQGVGFRPFVYRLASRLGLRGWVRNNLGDVAIYLEGPGDAVSRFPELLVAELPPLARVDEVCAEPVAPIGCADFRIVESAAEQAGSPCIPPDVATCEECLRELFTVGDPRYRYPFTNCTNCGPRLTIIESLPYDRPSTAMRSFPMCTTCNRQYHDPADRRFHAQPIACPACGPHLWLQIGDELVEGSDWECIELAARLLKQGKVVAIKGLGGFHLAVDALNPEAVAELRRRKGRPHKAFALMARLEQIAEFAELSEVAVQLLASPQAPIVIAPATVRARELLMAVAPDCYGLGFMLPYTPLHHLLMVAFGGPLVMTSGNLSEEPLCYENSEVLTRLSNVADAFLMHNRPIVVPCDDSVVMIGSNGQREAVPVMVRRARGYVPEPIELPVGGPEVLAVGPELKATFCLTRGHQAFLGQHIGDLGSVSAWERYLALLAHFERLLGVEPEVIAHDMHPDYATTRYAKERAGAQGLPAIAVQHHYAHALSCLAEHGWQPSDGPILAVVFDGTGYGADGAIWGGEWLLIRGRGFQRLAHLQYLPLAGGEAAINNVDRLAAGYLLSLALGEPEAWPPALRHLGARDLELIRLGISRPGSVATSSMGRLFDAVAACLGLARKVTYEAQAAVRLESAAVAAYSEEARPYSWALNGDTVMVGELLREICADARDGVAGALVARRFHQTVAQMVGQLCARFAGEHEAQSVVLSGGCFQNVLLLELCCRALRAEGLTPVVPRNVPPNDGGISLGQAFAACLQFAEGPW